MRARVGLVAGDKEFKARAVSWFTGSEYCHIVVGFGDWCVSGEMGGAKLRRPASFKHILWLDIDLTDEQHAVVIDRALAAVGAPYNLVAVILDAFQRLGVPVPYAVVDAATHRRRHRTCAELVAEAFLPAGVDLFPMPGFPYPAALLNPRGVPDGGAGWGMGTAGSDFGVAVLNPDSRSENEASRRPGRRWAREPARTLGRCAGAGRAPAPAQ